ncbi:hypothetical protein FB107DRAFT_276811 [Schizophyllum commune]
MANTAEPKYCYECGDIVLEVESTPYRIHSFHLQRATSYFDKDIQARRQGSNLPIVLKDVKRSDLENLLWFFYESAYKWFGLVDDSLRVQWESVLLLAEQFEMRQVAIVASHALDRMGVLDDIRKISLCVKHVRDKDWALEELIEDKSFRLHSYHLKRASKVFADMYLLPKPIDTDAPEERAIALDVKAADFANLIWFFYGSPYEWTPTVPYPSISQAKWESVLRLADMFEMEDVAQVATYALDRCGALSDMRKIALCVRHQIPREWALEALKNVCSRDEVISVEEAKGMGVVMMALVAQARERFYRAGSRASALEEISAGRRLAIAAPIALFYKPPSLMQSANTSASVSHHGTYYIDEGDIIMRAENTLFRFHSFHLQRDTAYFDDSIASLDANPGQGSVGSIDANPLPVDDVNAIDFEHLLWFCYESAYNWSSTSDPVLTPKWESILRLADKFGMERTAKVACYALGRAGALPDVRKIALCAKHGMGKDWIIEELERIISRPTPLTPGEAAEIGSPIAVAVLAAARMLTIPQSHITTEGTTEANPIVIDAKADQFRSFLWFLYDSSYGWSHIANPDSADRWEDTLAIADMFSMDEIARVATYALDYNIGLSDIRKISLTFRHGLDMTWATESIKSSPTIPNGMVRFVEPIYSYEDGDIVLEVETWPYRIHSFHLYRATDVFDEEIQARQEGRTGAIVLPDVKRADFENLLWFFYESAYKWFGLVDQTYREQWESVLLVAEQLKMRQVAIVASHALDRMGALDDIRKISLCAKHVRDQKWVLEELVRTVDRKEPLNLEEGKQLDIEMTIAITAARHSLLESRLPLAAEKCSSTGKCWEAGHDDDDPDVVCFLGVHTCNKLHQKACPMLSEVSARDAVDDMLTDENLFAVAAPENNREEKKRNIARAPTQGDSLFLVEGKSYRLHSYHLKRASKIFSDMYLLPKSTRAKKHVEGATPLDVKAEDFMNLIWYFYESPYEWTPTIPDPSTSQAKWESVLRLADLFDMEEAAQVATYALDRCNALGDVRKIALCVRHKIRLDWALEALKNVCGREQGLSVAEAREVGADMIALLALARERFFRGGSQMDALEGIVRETIIESS